MYYKVFFIFTDVFTERKTLAVLGNLVRPNDRFQLTSLSAK